MTPSLTRLIEDSLGPVGVPIDRAAADTFLSSWGVRGSELAELLTSRNGFYAFDSALLVRPIGAADPLRGLEDWNRLDHWNEYGDLSALLFFAEDLFGHQFAISGEQIVSFDLETGEQEVFADSFDSFTTRLFDDPSLHTGWPLAHEWQDKFSAIALGTRLVPRRPFVLGGDYVLENLVAVSEEEGVRARAKLARHLKELPPGSSVTYELRPVTANRDSL